jgi:hypothetical protein
LMPFSWKCKLVLKSLVNPNPFPLMKICTSTLHVLLHLPIHLHFMQLEKLKMHSF